MGVDVAASDVLGLRLTRVNFLYRDLSELELVIDIVAVVNLLEFNQLFLHVSHSLIIQELF